MCAMICGCDVSPYKSAESRYDELVSATEDEDFERVGEILNRAGLLVQSRDEISLKYNHAVLWILQGKCSEASQILNEIVLDEKSLSPMDWSEPRKDLSSEMTVDDIFRLSYQALALAQECPFSAQAHHGVDDTQVLDYLYKAFDRGLDTSEQISSVIAENHPDCHDWIKDPQEKTSTPDAAIELFPNDFNSSADYVVCPGDGLWFKVALQSHNQLKAGFDLFPINRLAYLDESGQLRFAQFHVDVFDSIQENMQEMRPVIHFRQSLPVNLMDKTSEDKVTLDLPEFTAEKSGDYYIHLYPERNGEAVVRPHLDRQFDCRYQDDGKTYSQDLVLKPVLLKNNHSVRDLIFCPNRPDHYQFDLNSDQSAMITIETTDQRVKDPDFLSLLLNENRLSENNEIKFPNESHGSATVYYPEQSISKDSVYLLLIQVNALQNTAYHLELSAEDSLEYNIHIVKSSPCSGRNETVSETLNMQSQSEKTGILRYPFYQCERINRQIQPQFSRPDEIRRSKLKLHYFTQDPVKDGFVKLTHQIQQNDTNYLIETAQREDSIYRPAVTSSAFGLSKPLTSDTILSIETYPKGSGFMFLTEEPIENGDDDSDSGSSQNQNRESGKKDSNKDNTTSNHSSRDQASEEKTSLLGTGSDTQGTYSQPDQDSEGNQAHEFDPQSMERDHIDALLDTIEQGEHYIPLGGRQKVSVSDKKW